MSPGRKATSNPEVESLLSGLGKATRRGIRKCPKCKTINGTRGNSCKNRLCNMLFKEESGPSKSQPHASLNKAMTQSLLISSQLDRSSNFEDLECCRLVADCGTHRTVFSVCSKRKVNAEKFVVTLVHENVNESTSTQAGEPDRPVQDCDVDGLPNPLWPKYDTCFFSGCKRIAKSAENRCSHMVACANNPKGLVGTPLRVKHSVLNQMSISAEMKHEIWLCARKYGPLVQRINESTMVVRTRVDELHCPLGTLFVTFQNNQATPGVKCSCVMSHNIPAFSILPCIHFYSCIAVFASDPKLSEEFSFFIGLLQQEEPEENSLKQVIILEEEEDNWTAVKANIIDGNSDLPANKIDQTGIENDRQHIEIELSNTNGEIRIVTLPSHRTTTSESVVITKPSNTSLETTSTLSSARLPLFPNSHNATESQETSTQQNFTEWLSSITEEINETMHFELTGGPMSLTFRVSQKFFDCLKSRIITGSVPGKIRLPDATTVNVRKSNPPLGTFTTYTWSIMNVVLVKKIFDTPLVHLQLTRQFMRMKDGSFQAVDSPSLKKYEPPAKVSKKTNIPDEYKTFLKVGKMSVDNEAKHPFVIEWTPNLLPKLNIGELKITFQFGHQKNGKVVNTSEHTITSSI